MGHPPISRVQWAPTYRIIPSRYPPVDLFERIAPPEDWEFLAEIEGLTNDRLRDQAGDISLVPVSERLSGPGSTPVMAAFTHPGESRFSDGSFGVYYAAKESSTAIAESASSRGRFLSATAEPPMRVEMRTYLGKVNADLHDIRGGWPELHNPNSYAASQAVAKGLRTAGSLGLVFDSVRCSGGECFGAFRSAALAPFQEHAFTIQGPHYFYDWDGRSITRYLQAGETTWLPIPTAA